MTSLGVFYALLALVSWAFGDFLIQRSARDVGVFKTLFIIGAFGAVVLLPFVLPHLSTSSLLMIGPLLGLITLVMIFGALFNFKALKEGKISVIEPIMGLELPITVLLGITLASEQLSSYQIILIVFIVIGIILSITHTGHHKNYHKRLLEKGVILAGVGSITMALSNFLVGVGSQQVNPLYFIWLLHLAIALIIGTYLMATGSMRSTLLDLKKEPHILLPMAALDNAAWVIYGYATTLLPISIAITISEGYIVLASYLGLRIGKEKLQSHQKVGIVLSIGGILLLSYLVI